MMEFFNQDCQGLVLDSGEGEYIVKGKLTKLTNNNILFIAPNSPTLINSFYGAGLPFPNTKVAFENTQNRGVVKANAAGEFQFKIRYPNSYYRKLGTELIPPTVFIKICNDDKIHAIKLGDNLPFSSLEVKPEDSIKMKNILTQEQILLNNGF